MDTLTDKIVEIHRFANAALKEHGLDDWQFKLSNHKVLVGQCKHRNKVIHFSLYYLERSTWEEVKDTILHEIAHALVGLGHGHDYVWESKCIEIGAKPERLAGEDAKTNAKPNYVIKCPSCGWKLYRYRMRKRNFGSRCPECDTEVKIYKIERK